MFLTKEKDRNKTTADVFLIIDLGANYYRHVLLAVPICILFSSLSSIFLVFDIQSNDEHTLGSSFYCSFISLEQA